MRAIQGLTDQEAEARRAQGLGNDVELKTSRTYGEIIRRNLFNFVHTVLFIIGGIFILMGRWGDAFNSAGLILLNVAIGVFQEIRAKRKLDEIALLTRPKISIIRNGEERSVDPAEIVKGDAIVIRPGDQLVVDGPILEGVVEMDESLLTGESDAVKKTVDDELLSASFCLTGTAIYEAEKVGNESFASRLTESAREFKVEKTPLQRQVDYVIRLLSLMAMFFLLLLFLASQIHPEIPFLRSVQVAAVLMGLIPVGLFFITIVSYALGAVRLIDAGALIQETNAVESLANVDVLCTDKTGTLTANRIEYRSLVTLNGLEEAAVEAALGDFAHSASVTNKTSDALVNALPGANLPLVDEVPFSSARKWSAESFDTETRRGTYVMGAPEMLAPYLADGEALQSQVNEFSAEGLRVLLFAHNGAVTSLHPNGDTPDLPLLEPLAILTFGDELRPHVQETIEGFRSAGVQLKVISGDNPETVAALARQAGLGDDLKLVSGPELAAMSDVEFDQTAEEATVFGRITPEQKEKLVDALRRGGHYVAMTGDGVNDVLSLKKANLGIAMESGSAATRGVADIVLLDDSFGAMVPAFQEGQRIVNGMQGIIRLYLSRIFTAAMLFTAIALVGLGTPFVPSNMAMYALLVVGIPTMFMALWAAPKQNVDLSLSSALYFSAPAAFLAMVFGVLFYTGGYLTVSNQWANYDISPAQIQQFKQQLGYTLTDDNMARAAAANLVGRSAMTGFLIFVGVILINFALPPFRWFAVMNEQVPDKRMLAISGLMIIAYIAIMAIKPLRDFYEMIVLRPQDYLVMVLAAVLWTVILRFFYKRRLLERFLQSGY
jgi:cation-transporting ATPase E